MSKKKAWIQVWTGRKFYPFDPKPDMIDIEDVAHHLSMMCRFGGAVRFHYSVAQHSCYVSDLMFERFNPGVYYNETGDELSCEYAAMMGLLHDAPEAYIGDMVRPLKAEMEYFRKLETKIDSAINRRFGLTKHKHPIYPLLHECDNAMLATERRDVMGNSKLSLETAMEWTLRSTPEQFTIYEWTPSKAKAEFMKRFNWLQKAIAK